MFPYPIFVAQPKIANTDTPLALRRGGLTVFMFPPSARGETMT